MMDLRLKEYLVSGLLSRDRIAMQAIASGSGKNSTSKEKEVRRTREKSCKVGSIPMVEIKK